MTEQKKHKLSASALNTFLKSPKAYYWGYIAGLVPIQQSVALYNHDMICGILWAEFVHRFYNGDGEDANRKKLLDDWLEQTDGWVPEKAQDRLTKALEAWSSQYYQMFNPNDGARGKDKSELKVEDDRFIGYLDGLSDDGVVHEVKSTSRSPQLAGQLWKVTNSIQVKLYAVLTEATGVRIEFAFKDAPHALYRGPETPVSKEQLGNWRKELNTLADFIYSLGTDINNYPCHPDGCCLVTKGITSMCQYEMLCTEGVTELTKYGFKAKKHR